jgi:xanthine dehydrogenase/oxidase
LNRAGDWDDEEVFVSSIALYIGAVVGIVVADTEDSAQAAAAAIEIEYEDLQPKIYSIDDAIAHQSYFGNEIVVARGDVEKAIADAEHIVEDDIYIGGQEHFYMETNACIVVPSKDDQEVVVHMGHQGPSAVQDCLAKVLGIEASRVIFHTKRIGGAFGGKESRS